MVWIVMECLDELPFAEKKRQSYIILKHLGLSYICT